MTFPSLGGGHQIGDGNLNEVTLEIFAPLTATSTTTLSAAQLTADILVGNPSTTAATYTLPTVAALEALVVNAKVGTGFRLNIINLGTSTGVITVAVGTGWTIVGLATIAVSLQSEWAFVKTGTGTWTAYRVA